MPDPTTSLTLMRGPAWPNRTVLAPMTNLQSNEDGSLSDDEFVWLTRRAEGGFGVVMTCATSISPEGKGFKGQLAAWDDNLLPGLRRLAAALRVRGAVSVLQLHHGGNRAKARPAGTAGVAPWKDPALDVRALSTSEIASIIDKFADVAARAELAGFDGVEVHGAHGYLLAQFLDAEHNQRDDGYGNDLDGRSRILFDVLSAIRATTRPDFQVGIRLSPHRFGVTLHESLLVAERLMASGMIDYLDMSLWDAQEVSPDPNHEGKTLTELFTNLPRHGVRLGVAGKITSGAAAQLCLDQGADFVLVGTGGILHHDFAARLASDPAFESVSPPVTREHLAAEGLGTRFIDYLADDWDDFVL